MTLIELHKRIRSIKIKKLMDSVILEHESEIIDANTDQLSKGFYSDGDRMPDYANENYAQFKQSIGSKAPYGITDLKLTGDFHSGFFMKPDSDGFQIWSSVSKTDELVGKYGADIFGISPESKKELKSNFSQSLVEKIKNVLL